MLLSKDLAKLVYAPAGIGASATIPAEVREVAAGAFAECAGLKSVVAPGNVEAIGAGAFPVEVVANAIVALAPGEDYDIRKAVWQDAGFTHFSEPAAPGEVTKPSQEKSGFAYRLLDDFTLAVSWEGEEEPEADLVLPTSAELNGVEYRVTAVAANGFQGRTGLSSVRIRAPITTIGDGAFDGCSNLASIELPDGLDYVGGRAFAGTALRSVTLPASLETVAGGGVH